MKMRLDLLLFLAAIGLPGICLGQDNDYEEYNKCWSMQHGDSKNTCLAGVSQDQNVKMTYCGNVKNNDIKNSCLARNLREPSYCSNISDQKLRESCQKSLGVSGTNTMSGYAEPANKSINFSGKKYAFIDRTRDHNAYINFNDIYKYAKDSSTQIRVLDVVTIFDGSRSANHMGQIQTFRALKTNYYIDCKNSTFSLKTSESNSYADTSGLRKLPNYGGPDAFDIKIPEMSQAWVLKIYACSNYNANNQSQRNSSSISSTNSVSNSSDASPKNSNRVTCSSIKRAEARCDWNFKMYGNPRILNQLSSTECKEGWSYELDPDSNQILVRNGCRAVFGN
jgi:hypothetical protein